MRSVAGSHSVRRSVLSTWSSRRILVGTYTSRHYLHAACGGKRQYKVLAAAAAEGRSIARRAER